MRSDLPRTGLLRHASAVDAALARVFLNPLRALEATYDQRGTTSAALAETPTATPVPAA